MAKTRFFFQFFIKTLDIKRYSSHNFQDNITSFENKVDRTIYRLTMSHFFVKCILRGFIYKIPILSINPLKTLDIKRYSSHNFQNIITSFGHKVDMTIYMLTRYRFFEKCILRGLIDKILILSINPLKTHLSKKRYIVTI